MVKGQDKEVGFVHVVDNFVIMVVKIQFQHLVKLALEKKLRD